jgi:MFS family permease
VNNSPATTEPSRSIETNNAASRGTEAYYGWWIVLAAFLNLFLVVGIIFYGFPAFYPYFVQDLHFTRAQLTQGFLLGFLFAGLPFGIVAGALIDRIGARTVILCGVALVSSSLILMSRVTHFWEFELLCIVEVIGYVFAGPIANQVLVARWFERRRGQAMGYAYLGLGLGGVVAPILVNYLARSFGWRPALELIGATIALVLIPTGLWITRSKPADRGIDLKQFGESSIESKAALPSAPSAGVAQAVRTVSFWLILLGSTLVIGAIGAVIQHFILFLKDSGYTATVASRYLSILLTASLGGRVVVGYIADRFSKSFSMAIFYFLIGASVLLLAYPQSTTAVWAFAAVFGFSMGADYMLIPLVVSENFGTGSLR